MLKHEYFEELCAAASAGQATADELAELERHASDCYLCQRAYLDYVSIAAHEFVAAEHAPTLSLAEAQECLNSDLFTQRFFDRAEREGIVFSEQVARENQPFHPAAFLPTMQGKSYAMSLGAVALVVALTTGYIVRGALNKPHRVESASKHDGSQTPGRGATVSNQIEELKNSNRFLESELNRVNMWLTAVNDKLTVSEASQKSISDDRQKLLFDRSSLEFQMSQLRHQLAQSQLAIASAQADAERQRKLAGDLEASNIAAQVELSEVSGKLKDESAALDKERELLAMGHDVSDLMGARNLHILDVVDTDSRGKNRPAFGRIFFTEGKSLVFYAYDLNEAKMQKASYQYQVWAKKEGQNHPVRRLGIFYSDDKVQHRWVFKCDNPKILNEIDSVFVTLGRPNSDPSHPEGSRLMHAYLRGIPNHP